MKCHSCGNAVKENTYKCNLCGCFAPGAEYFTDIESFSEWKEQDTVAYSAVASLNAIYSFKEDSAHSAEKTSYNKRRKELLRVERRKRVLEQEEKEAIETVEKATRRLNEIKRELKDLQLEELEIYDSARKEVKQLAFNSVYRPSAYSMPDIDKVCFLQRFKGKFERDPISRRGSSKNPIALLCPVSLNNGNVYWLNVGIDEKLTVDLGLISVVASSGDLYYAVVKNNWYYFAVFLEDDPEN